MTKFEITIDLVAESGKIDDIPNYGNREIGRLNPSYQAKWDVTLTNTVEAETAEDAAATIGDDMRKAFIDIDPDWHCLVFEGDDEVLELGGEPDDEPSTWKRFSILIDIDEDYISYRDHPNLKPSQRCAVNPDGKFSGAEDWLLAQINNAILADGVVYLASFEEAPDHPTEEELRKYD